MENPLQDPRICTTVAQGPTTPLIAHRNLKPFGDLFDQRGATSLATAEPLWVGSRRAQDIEDAPVIPGFWHLRLPKHEHRTRLHVCSTFRRASLYDTKAPLRLLREASSRQSGSRLLPACLTIRKAGVFAKTWYICDWASGQIEQSPPADRLQPSGSHIDHASIAFRRLRTQSPPANSHAIPCCAMRWPTSLRLAHENRCSLL
jgi:hypothetical protein